MKKGLAIVGCVLLSLVFFTGFSSLAYGGNKEVVFLSLSDFTGPAIGEAVSQEQGRSDYFKYVNLIMKGE